MEATTARRTRATTYFAKVCDQAKMLDDSQKLELATILIESVRLQTAPPPTMKRFTMDDINAMLDEAEADFAAGKGIPDEEVWRKWDEELAREEQRELEMAEAI